MLIGNRWKVESDAMNYILSEKHVSKKPGEGYGKEYWLAIEFYAHVSSALKELVDMEVRGTGLTDFILVVDKIAELKKLINELELSPEATRAT